MYVMFASNKRGHMQAFAQASKPAKSTVPAKGLAGPEPSLHRIKCNVDTHIRTSVPKNTTY